MRPRPKAHKSLARGVADAVAPRLAHLGKQPATPSIVLLPVLQTDAVSGQGRIQSYLKIVSFRLQGWTQVGSVLDQV